MPVVELTGEGARRAGHGNTLSPAHLASGRITLPGSRVQLQDGSGRLIGIAEPGPDGLLHPLVVLG